ncbi:MAG: pullulanase-type alpha-1,6-glucosidase [Deltaproteobacteria bacterium]|nr:MAG: pullulanase-type alpha-1,6-glucosidase [Deltaproteobacteria bacterium]
MKHLSLSLPVLHALLVIVPLGLVGCGDDPKTEADTAADTSEVADTVETDGTADTSEDATPTAFVLHYHRADGDYAGWTANVTGDVDGSAALTAGDPDGFGATFVLPLTDGAASVTYSFTKDGEADPAEAVTVSVADAAGIWHFSGGAEPPLTTEPPAIPGADQLAVYYLRDDDSYAGWGLHLWEDVANPPTWTAAQGPGGIDETLGAWFLVDLLPDAAEVGLIVHKGDTKDPGPDMFVKLADTGNIIFLITGSTEIFSAPTPIPDFAITGARAHWLTEDTLAWTPKDGATQVELRYAADASIEIAEADVVGGTVLTLTKDAAGLSADLKAKWPHLASRQAFKLDAGDLSQVPTALEGELVVVARDADGLAVDATRVQIPGVLDDLFTYTGPLGVTWDAGVPHFALWAPTAQAVKLIHYNASDKAVLDTLDLTKTDGVWTYDGADSTWGGGYYRYELTVFHPTTLKVETLLTTDPYSVSLSTDSAYSHLADLDAAALVPAGWEALAKPALDAFEDIVIYEAHVRDFSANDATVPADHRGKFLAFTDDSDGMDHLKALATAGVTHIHLLPIFDIASVGEDTAHQVTLDDTFDTLCSLNANVPAATCDAHGTTPIREVLAGLDPSTGDAQEIASWMGGLDPFNWGYDPYHYTAPEGSYATDPEGSARVLELREAVAALNAAGLRVVMDVVYNHTNAAGTGEHSVLDKVVPGYYHRLNVDTGLVETSTCCANTATEHAMMERLMVDSLVTWARAYKIDGFRFDLMGHHMVSNIEAVRAALDALTLADDGVDGSRIYLYGEGWDFGEVASNTRGENASQLNLSGTGIGSFNDRLRDAVRGGSAFDSASDLRVNQGFGNGQYVAPNELAEADTATLDAAGVASDLIQVAMAGGLSTYKLKNHLGLTKSGYLTGYNGAPAGYTADPQELINYVSAHDNQTLFDNIAYKAPTGTTMAVRVRMQNLSLDTALLAQGIPFIHMGAEILRSKSMERDSYNSGDWFNAVDWTLESNNWNVGLPNAEKDEANWTLIGEILGDAALSPAKADLEAALAHFEEMVAVRKSSVLFRLRTAEDIKQRVDFYMTGDDLLPGLMVMTLSDGTCAGADLDPNYDGIVVIINARPDAQDVTLAGLDGFALHPLLAGSADAIVQGASFDDDTDTFSVPAWTTAVFVAAQGASQGGTLPCSRLNATDL